MALRPRRPAASAPRTAPRARPLPAGPGGSPGVCAAWALRRGDTASGTGGCAGPTERTGERHLLRPTHGAPSAPPDGLRAPRPPAPSTRERPAPAPACRPTQPEARRFLSSPGGPRPRVPWRARAAARPSSVPSDLHLDTPAVTQGPDPGPRTPPCSSLLSSAPETTSRRPSPPQPPPGPKRRRRGPWSPPGAVPPPAPPRPGQAVPGQPAGSITRSPGPSPPLRPPPLRARPLLGANGASVAPGPPPLLRPDPASPGRLPPPTRPFCRRGRLPAGRGRLGWALAPTAARSSSTLCTCCSLCLHRTTPRGCLSFLPPETSPGPPVPSPAATPPPQARRGAPMRRRRRTAAAATAGGAALTFPRDRWGAAGAARSRGGSPTPPAPSEPPHGSVAIKGPRGAWATAASAQHRRDASAMGSPAAALLLLLLLLDGPAARPAAPRWAPARPALRPSDPPGLALTPPAASPRARRHSDGAFTSELSRLRESAQLQRLLQGLVGKRSQRCPTRLPRRVLILTGVGDSEQDAENRTVPAAPSGGQLCLLWSRARPQAWTPLRDPLDGAWPPGLPSRPGIQILEPVSGDN
ncbi:secretin [Choloepus didactylus]|uniref:secretin n=1 Tax=Choloepus didactylus TaxID=27675 RepID=UPI00189F3ADD|nr:secretin [Choloepus didactylus]